MRRKEERGGEEGKEKRRAEEESGLKRGREECLNLSFSSLCLDTPGPAEESRTNLMCWPVFSLHSGAHSERQGLRGSWCWGSAREAGEKGEADFKELKSLLGHCCR